MLTRDIFSQIYTMITVEMSEDIRKYEIKSWGPFTSRQGKFIIISLIYAIPLGIVFPGELYIKILSGFLFALPCILCGYIKMDGMYFETLVLRLLYLYFLTPAKRKCKNELEFKKDIKKRKLAEERKKMSKMTSKQKKAYEKEKKLKQKMIYSSKKEYHIYK